MSDSTAAVVLGSTGAIGSHQVENYAQDEGAQVVALAAAGSNLDLLARQAVELGVFGIALHEGSPEQMYTALDRANANAGTDVRPEVIIGPDMAVQAASAGVHTVVNAIRGIHGLRPSLAALETGANLAVANTETLLSRSVLEKYLPRGVALSDRLTLLTPSLAGIQQTLQTHAVSKVIITTRSPASLRGRRRNTASRVNAHTGFAAATSILELRAITDVPIEIVEHDGPIASIIELVDGRTILTPRPHLLSTWSGSTHWSFKESHLGVIEFAQAVATEGGTYPVVFYAANGAAVEAYLDGAIEFGQIVQVIAAIMDSYESPQEVSARGVIDASQWAQNAALTVIRSIR